MLLVAAPLRSAALKIVLQENGRECVSQSLDAELFEVCTQEASLQLPNLSNCASGIRCDSTGLLPA
jgi:hypothetical protein